MNDKYTNNDIENFFGQFKRLPDCIELEKVHHLVKSPEAKASLSGKTFIKPFNLIIMTTTFITGLTVLTLWFSPTKVDNSSTIKMRQPTDSVKIERKIQNQKTSTFVIPEKAKPTTVDVKKSKKQDISIAPRSAVPPKAEANISASTNKKLLATICNWPQDTLLNKRSLFVRLTEQELEKVGLFIDVDSSKSSIINRYKALYKDSMFRYYPIYTHSYGKIKTIKYTATFNTFYTSDTACTSERWDSPFYNSIDTLIPVVRFNRIYWLKPVQGVFDSLPERYQYLKSIYANLKCIKKQYPNNQYVNYWNKSMLLRDIKYITLSKAELSSIGFKFENDSNGYYIVNPTTRKKYWGVQQRKTGNLSLGFRSKDTIVPISIPAYCTDEKGLGQHSLIRNNNTNNLQFSPDVLIPIKIPLNEYVKGFNYYDIYWYNPTDSFISLLPERIRSTLKAEKDAILKDSPSTTTTSCTYFEACQSTLQLDNLIVFPNPASQNATVQFSVNQDIVGYISLTNMAGVGIKQLISSTTMKAGFNSFQLDLSGIQSGIYIVSIVSNKGFKTKRLIVTQ